MTRTVDLHRFRHTMKYWLTKMFVSHLYLSHYTGYGDSDSVCQKMSQIDATIGPTLFLMPKLRQNSTSVGA